MTSTHCLVIHNVNAQRSTVQFFPDAETAHERARIVQGIHGVNDPVDTYVTQIIGTTYGQRPGLVPEKGVDPADHYDAAAAIAEGWAISQADGNEDGTMWRLESCDDAGRIIGDARAAFHVCQKARENSQNHIAALKFLRTFEPKEHEIVLRMAREQGFK